MASSRAFLLVAVAIMVVADFSPALPKRIPVGGDNPGGGWQFGFNYQTWANGVKFNVNDTLVFEYSTGEHNVIKVNQQGLNNCQAAATDELKMSGSDEFILTEVGPQYFICGKPQHCSEGMMKLAINVNK